MGIKILREELLNSGSENLDNLPGHTLEKFMNTPLQSILEQLDAQEEVSQEQLFILLNTDAEEISEAANESGITLDLCLEAMLEQLANQEVTEPTADRIRNYWMQLDELPDGTPPYELTVRCAELLARKHLQDSTPASIISGLSKSEDWKERLVAAWTARDESGPEWEAIREYLAEDSFEDDNGNFLVREGAGFRQD
jgi:hypothetical protein